MLERVANGRGKFATIDKGSSRFWIGTDTDNETATLGELLPVSKLIGQFYSVSPWSGEKCDVEFNRRALSVAASCLRSEKPTVTQNDDEERKAFSALWRHARRIRDNCKVVGVESPLFTEAQGVIGFPCCAFDENGCIVLCDWKTGDLMLTAKCRFNAPFSHLVADPVTIYSLQCSAYQVIADIGGYFGFAKFAAPRIAWLHGEGGDWKVDEITCRDLRREASMMIMSKCYMQWWREWQARCPF